MKVSVGNNTFEVTKEFAMECVFLKDQVEDMGDDADLQVKDYGTSSDHFQICLDFFNKKEPTLDPKTEEFNQLMNYVNYLAYSTFLKELMKLKVDVLKSMTEAEQKLSLGLPADYDWKDLFVQLGIEEIVDDAPIVV